MAEVSTTQLHCRECDAELIVKPGGGKPRYCPDCKLKRSRVAARDYQRRRRAGVTPEPERYPCPDCDGEVVWQRKGPRPDRCGSCREQHQRQYMKDWQRAKGHKASGETITLTCKPCGSPFDWVVEVGRRPWKCDRCRAAAYAAHKLASAAAVRAKTPRPDLNRSCVDCESHFTQGYTVGPRILRCRPCAEARAARLKSEYSKAMSAALSAAVQVTYEIEGRWSACLGCGSRLACERMGLVRKWCESCLPGRKKAVLDAWKLANPDAWREIACRANRVRRARLASVPSEPYSRLSIFERDKWVCQLCKKKISKRYSGTHPRAVSIDHQIPLELGGPDTAANVTAAHFGCNSAKRSRYMPKGEQLALIG